MMQTSPGSCERAAEFVSLELDGELSRFERALLRRHLRRCEPCAEYARRIAAITELVRTAPLEPIRMQNDFWRRRRRLTRLVQKTAVTAAVAAVAIWLVVASLPATPQRTPLPNGAVGTSGRSVADNRTDWSAGLPRSVEVVQQVPGGLYTSSVSN